MTGPAPRRYLVVPPATAPGELAAALDAGDVACVLLRTGEADEAVLRAAVAALRPVAQERDVAFLLEDRVELAADTGCDGVHLSGPAGFRAARARLGADAIVGVACGGSRHDAMAAAEDGADYVAFGRPGPEPEPADPALLSWWQELMTVPCVAFGARSAEDRAALARAGADFVAVEGPLRDAPDANGAAG